MKLLNHRTRPLLHVGILALAYFVTGKLAVSILGLVKAEASPVWPPAGIALAAMLLQGRRMWPGIVLGSVLLNSSGGIPSAVIVTSTFSVTVQALAGEALLSRSGFSAKLDRLRDVLALVAGAVIGSTLVGSTISNLCACILGWVQWSNFLRNWWTIWLGDGMGILIVTPVLLTLNHAVNSCKFPLKLRCFIIFNYLFRNRQDACSTRDEFSACGTGILPLLDSGVKSKRKSRIFTNLKAFFESNNYKLQITKYFRIFQETKNRYNLHFLIVNYSELALWMTLLVSVSSLVFCSKTQSASALYPLEYLPFPLIVWAALRFRQPGAIFAYSIVSYIAILGAVQGGGPFLVRSENLQQAVLFLQAFTGTIAIVALMLAAAVAEREQALEFLGRTAALLRDREASLANAQRIAQLGNWDLNFTPIKSVDRCEQSAENNISSNIELRWSDELYRLLGLAPGTVKPTPEVFLQAVHPEDRELVARSQCQAMFERKPYSINYRIVLPDGGVRAVCEQSAIHSNIIAATVQDVTERHRAEAALRTSSERDRLLSEMALRIRQSLDLPEILNTTVAEVREFFKADRAFIGIIDAVGTNLPSPVYGKIVAESVGAQCRSILGLVLDDENQFQKQKTFYARNRVQTVSDTATVQVSDQVAQLYRDYQIRATLNVPIVLGDEFFGILAVNQCSGPRQWQEFEIDLLEKLATQVAIALSSAQLLQQVKELNANLESQVEERTRQLQQKMYELQESNRLKDLFLHAVSHNLRTPVMGMLMLLKNLLNKSSCESIQDVPVSRSILQRIVQASEHQLTVVNSLLDAHATEVKGIFLNPEPLELLSLCSEIVACLAPVIAKNQATLIQEIPADLPQVNADSKHLQRVLENLLTNAVKHNHPGVNITLKAEVVEVKKMLNCEDNSRVLTSHHNPVADLIPNRISAAGDRLGMGDTAPKNQEILTKIHPHSSCQIPRYQGQIGNTGDKLPEVIVKMVRCTVTDNGVGISAKQRESLFELYVQDPNSRQLTGLGLGLYISKQIIKAHGGEIGVESTPGGGSTFWFSLPAAS
ncbi:MASE1 domain-containing protein [Microcoleus sp. LEGE 07076]|uniref:sensor histidine kinase n=1 Tax=Microcoleus sp. LEGE 07076 TaxID=915322 RepID=UPI00187FB9C2|nr:MASE1 domain-containing protein [Microcoleus sp. LEGE 07076]MBE9187246.1 MASE1 domain-containing protein [Microcoleus sp. LEGE 07076]